MGTTIERKEALTFIEENRGKFISVAFVKRSNGENREMVFRQGVKKHLAGGPAAYNFKDKGLLPVWEVLGGNEGKEAYRSVPIEGLLRVKIDGEWKEIE